MAYKTRLAVVCFTAGSVVLALRGMFADHCFLLVLASGQAIQFVRLPYVTIRATALQSSALVAFEGV